MAENNDNDTKLILGYWEIGGVAAPIRMLLHYLKVDYENVFYSPTNDWYAKKKEFYQDPNRVLPNLPHLIDGDYFLTEAFAIPYYICSKYNRLDLFGETPQEQGRVRQIESVIQDINFYFTDPILGPSEKAKAALEENLKEGKPVTLLLQELFKIIGDKQFITGKFSYADLKTANFLIMFRDIALNHDLKCPICGNDNVIKYIKGIRGMEEFKDYIGSEIDLPPLAERTVPGYKPVPLP